MAGRKSDHSDQGGASLIADWLHSTSSRPNEVRMTQFEQSDPHNAQGEEPPQPGQWNQPGYPPE
jgi:hypothetical protein